MQRARQPRGRKSVARLAAALCLLVVATAPGTPARAAPPGAPTAHAGAAPPPAQKKPRAPRARKKKKPAPPKPTPRVPVAFVMGDYVEVASDPIKPKPGSRVTSPEGPGALPEAGIATAFPDVVAIGGERDLHCTGVLVGPRHVLTARHCVPASRVVAGKDVSALAAQRAVLKSATPLDARLDVALLTLDAPLDAPIRKRRAAADASPPSGLVRLVGFGANNASGARGFGVKRFTDVEVNGWACDGARPLTMGCDRRNEMAIPRQLHADTCSGDSGGPAFEHTADGLRLVAVTSRGIPGARARCGDGGIYTRVDRIAGWLDETIQRDHEEVKPR